MKGVFLLTGPIASGKSYIGRLMENHFGIPFLEYEDVFVSEYQKGSDGYLGRAEPKAEKRIFDFLDENRIMCFENTMERSYSISILNRLQEMADVRIIYVDAHFDVTLERMSSRDNSSHVNWSEDDLERIYRNCSQLDLDFDISIDNTNLDEDDIVSELKPVIEKRKWYDNYVEIMFRGKKLRFSSWSGDNLSDYDMEYKPWSRSFRKENPEYLRNYNLKSGDIVIDAGAYEGTFTAYAAKAVGESGMVIAFEPDSENFRKLKENIELNHLNNVIVINKALWDQNKILKFNNKHTAGASVFFNKSPYMDDIEAVSLDNELIDIGVDKVDFIKMDVEGAEVHALRGCKKLLNSNNVNLAIATYHIVNGEETSRSVEDLLKDFGYSSETICSEHKTTYGSKKGGVGNDLE